MLGKNLKAKHDSFKHNNENMKLEFKFSQFVPEPELNFDEPAKLNVFKVGTAKSKEKKKKEEKTTIDPFTGDNL
jgi:hypothetical protein